MADMQCRFDNTAWGGLHAFTVPVVDMPDYPYDKGYAIGKDSYEAQSGKLWEYKWFDKETVTLHFRDIGSASYATLGSMVKEGKQFKFWKDYVNDATNFGTFMFAADSLDASEDVPGWSFDFPMREVE